MLWIPFWAAGVINGLGHWWGYRNFESSDTATNILPWGIWIGGEELHNNHHAFPSSAKFALRKWEVDIGWCAICVLRTLGLAKVLRVAPVLQVRPNASFPDAETLKAVLTHRFQAMTDYYYEVIIPTLHREELGDAGRSFQGVSRRLRRALANGGIWLDHNGSERLQAMLRRRPTLQIVCHYRDRLLALTQQRSSTDQALKNLQRWIADAEQSGISALQEFADRLKHYSLVTTS